MTFRDFEKEFLAHLGIDSVTSDRDFRIASNSRNFLESLERLYLRESDLDVAIKNPQLYDLERGELRDGQTNLVAKTEAFHEGVYATLSDLASLLGLVLSHEKRRGFQSTSVSSLVSLFEREFSIEYVSDVDAIKNSVHYRANYVSHRNQNPMYNWMTMGIGTIMYFPKWIRNESDEQSFIPPKKEEVMDAVRKLSLGSLKLPR